MIPPRRSAPWRERSGRSQGTSARSGVTFRAEAHPAETMDGGLDAPTLFLGMLRRHRNVPIS
jgi:hypothetical protein